MGTIAGCSTSRFSSAQTGHIVMPILHWLLPGSAPETLLLFHAVVRKTAHIVLFAVLLLLVHRGLRDRLPGGWLASAAVALVVALALGCLAELQQTLVPDRTGSLRDVGWDGLGATLALGARRLLWRA
jgi:VanZ family protein